MIKLLIADVDSMFFHSATDTMEGSIQKFNEKFQNMVDKTGATHYIGFVGRGKTFRNSIDKKYKSNRKSQPPKFMQALKEWAIAQYGFEECINYEADDAVAFWNNQDICIDQNGHFETRETFESVQSIMAEDSDEIIKYASVEKIVASPDKDILHSIAGNNFNYAYKIKEESKQKPKEELTDNDFNKGWWKTTTTNDAYGFKITQLIMGDSADGVGGLPKIGIVTATKWLISWDSIRESGLESEVLKKYIAHYGTSQGIYEFQKNYRLLHILDCEEDFVREVGEVPMIPEVRVVEEADNESDQIIEF